MTTNNLTTLEKKLNITFKNKELIHHAFVHRSYLNEVKEKLSSNERLEFLGDAILELIASEYLFQKYPELPEGMLTNIRSSIVNTRSLALLSRELDLGNYLLLSKGEKDSDGQNNESLLADVFEAFLGALYLDQGLEAPKKVLETFLFPRIPSIIKNKEYLDYKSRFQEYIQNKFHVSPTYEVIKTEGKDHEKTFWIVALVNSITWGEGQGKSKQEAEQKAAHKAFENKQIHSVDNLRK